MKKPTNTFLRRLMRNRAAILGSLFLILVAVASVIAPLLYPQGPFTPVAKPFLPPSWGFPFGTDSLGRDIAAGVVYGGRVSIIIGLAATAAAVLIGATVGPLAGYYRGRTDSILMRVTEFFQTIPAFLLALVLITMMSPSNLSIVIAISIVSWPPVARLVRGEFLRLSSLDYVQSAVCLGMSDRGIILKEILPNALSPLVVAGSLMIATAILTEAAVSFLGLGDPNTMSWGFIVGAGRSYLRDAWWVCTVPGVVILLTVLSVNLVGEAINDAMNPRLRQE